MNRKSFFKGLIALPIIAKLAPEILISEPKPKAIRSTLPHSESMEFVRLRVTSPVKPGNMVVFPRRGAPYDIDQPQNIVGVALDSGSPGDEIRVQISGFHNNVKVKGAMA